jgi:hypothetical protein
MIVDILLLIIVHKLLFVGFKQTSILLLALIEVDYFAFIAFLSILLTELNHLAYDSLSFVLFC